MTPTKYKVKDGITYFFYKKKQIENFHKRGKLHGDVGHLLVRRNNNILIYESYGTIERPFTDMQTISVVHNPLFDGKMPTDNELLIPPKPRHIRDTSLIIFDLNKKL